MIESGSTYTIKSGDGAKTKAKVVSITPKGRGHTVRYKAGGAEHSTSLRNFEKSLAA